MERESLPAAELDAGILEEQAFGRGRAYIWDTGRVEVRESSPSDIHLLFTGKKMTGRYHLQHMLWYPGNRWMLSKEPAAAVPGKRRIAKRSPQ